MSLFGLIQVNLVKCTEKWEENSNHENGNCDLNGTVVDVVNFLDQIQKASPYTSLLVEFTNVNLGQLLKAIVDVLYVICAHSHCPFNCVLEYIKLASNDKREYGHDHQGRHQTQN